MYYKKQLQYSGLNKLPHKVFNTLGVQPLLNILSTYLLREQSLLFKKFVATLTLINFKIKSIYNLVKLSIYSTKYCS